MHVGSTSPSCPRRAMRSWMSTAVSLLAVVTVSVSTTPNAQASSSRTVTGARPATAAVKATPAAKAKAKHIRVATGVSLWHTTFISTSKHREHATLLQCRPQGRVVSGSAPSRRTRASATPASTVLVAGAQATARWPASTVTSSTCTPRRPSRAAASSTPATSPRHRGPYWRANLYVVPSGRATIGPVKFLGRVTRGTQSRHGVPERSHRIFSVNTIFDAQKDRDHLHQHRPGVDQARCLLHGRIRSHRHGADASSSGSRRNVQLPAPADRLALGPALVRRQGRSVVADLMLKSGDAVSLADAVRQGSGAAR